jgi:RNA polymerase sigma-70 factor (ECF subfamily)
LLLLAQGGPAGGPAAMAEGESEEVRRAQQGDGEAFRRLMVRHQTQVSRLMWRFSRDPEVHEDLVQEAFIAAYSSLGSFRAEAPFGHWLARLATRVGYQYWKRQRRVRRVEEVVLEPWHEKLARPPEELSSAEAAEALHGLLDKLPPRDRLVLSLRYLENCSVGETAGRTGWSISMVKVQTWRARGKLLRLYREVVERDERV